ncbi:unnamed protein product [Hermetia illucens]|uniref:Uncharacterized protein n=1 Tax=Hermetia illucens TaxID=343691 RepID=A0A7R8UNH1_HERIL|nr:unnamed protein product [Hermetia illucens]
MKAGTRSVLVTSTVPSVEADGTTVEAGVLSFMPLLSVLGFETSVTVVLNETVVPLVVSWLAFSRLSPTVDIVLCGSLNSEYDHYLTLTYLFLLWSCFCANFQLIMLCGNEKEKCTLVEVITHKFSRPKTLQRRMQSKIRKPD